MFTFEFNVIKRWTITWLLLSLESRLLWRTQQLREDQIKVSLTLILFRFNEWTETFFYGVIKKLLYHPVVTACLLSYLVKESERPYKFLWETFKIIRLNKMFNICDICTHHFKHTHTNTTKIVITQQTNCLFEVILVYYGPITNTWLSSLLSHIGDICFFTLGNGGNGGINSK